MLARRHDAALQGAGIDRGRFPGPRDARRQRLGLGQAVLGQGQLGAAAKTFGVDAFDVAVTGQQELGHAANLAGRCRFFVPVRGARNKKAVQRGAGGVVALLSRVPKTPRPSQPQGDKPCRPRKSPTPSPC